MESQSPAIIIDETTIETENPEPVVMIEMNETEIRETGVMTEMNEMNETIIVTEIDVVVMSEMPECKTMEIDVVVMSEMPESKITEIDVVVMSEMPESKITEIDVVVMTEMPESKMTEIDVVVMTEMPESKTTEINVVVMSEMSVPKHRAALTSSSSSSSEEMPKLKRRTASTNSSSDSNGSSETYSDESDESDNGSSGESYSDDSSSEEIVVTKPINQVIATSSSSSSSEEIIAEPKPIARSSSASSSSSSSEEVIAGSTSSSSSSSEEVECVAVEKRTISPIEMTVDLSLYNGRISEPETPVTVDPEIELCTSRVYDLMTKLQEEGTDITVDDQNNSDLANSMVFIRGKIQEVDLITAMSSTSNEINIDPVAELKKQSDVLFELVDNISVPNDKCDSVDAPVETKCIPALDLTTQMAAVMESMAHVTKMCDAARINMTACGVNNDEIAQLIVDIQKAGYELIHQQMSAMIKGSQK